MNTFFAWLAELTIHRARAVVVVCVVLLGVCGALASSLTINSSRHTMVSASNPEQALQQAYFDRFGMPDALLIVVSGLDGAARQQVVESIRAELSRDPAFADRVLARADATALAELVLLQPLGARAEGVDEQNYLISSDGQRHFVVVYPPPSISQQAHEVADVVAQVRAARDVALANAPPGLTADVTGQPALVVDEQAAIAHGIATTSGVTGLGILVLLLWAFGRVRYALLALLPVILGVVATMAVARVLYGELNMVTSSCSSILMGLGIDFGVFLITRLGELMRQQITLDEAIRQTVRRAGPGMVIGALTTCVAFATTTTTEFTAYARLGVIVAVGLLLMLAFALAMVPALVKLTSRPDSKPPRELQATRGLIALAGRAPIVGAVAMVVMTLVCAAGLGRLTFNTRFYDFIPPHIESARALLQVEGDARVSPVRATVAVDGVEEARAMADALRGLDEVAAVLTPTDALPPLNLRGLQIRAAMPPASDTAEWRRAQATAQAIVARGHYLPTDLPPVLRHEFVSRDGAAIGLQVIPRGDIWDPEVARQFSTAVRQVAPQATGLAMQIEAHLRYIREGFLRAAVASAILVLLGVSLAFRSARDGVLAMLPCGLGFVWMLGLMGWTGIALDAANIVALPLILGIGVDAGVHLVERVRQDSTNPGGARLTDVLGGTGSAVLVSSLTTMVGFAALMLADYGAMFSLGLVMTIGVGSTLVASLVGLPALLVLMRRAQ